MLQPTEAYTTIPKSIVLCIYLGNDMDSTSTLEYTHKYNLWIVYVLNTFHIYNKRMLHISSLKFLVHST